MQIYRNHWWALILILACLPATQSSMMFAQGCPSGLLASFVCMILCSTETLRKKHSVGVFLLKQISICDSIKTNVDKGRNTDMISGSTDCFQCVSLSEPWISFPDHIGCNHACWTGGKLNYQVPEENLKYHCVCWSSGREELPLQNAIRRVVRRRQIKFNSLLAKHSTSRRRKLKIKQRLF